MKNFLGIMGIISMLAFIVFFYRFAWMGLHSYDGIFATIYLIWFTWCHNQVYKLEADNGN